MSLSLDSMKIVFYVLCVLVGAVIMLVICLRYYKDRTVQTGGLVLGVIAMILLLSPFWQSLVLEITGSGVKVALDNLQKIDSQVKDLSSVNDSLQTQISLLKNNAGSMSPGDIQRHLSVLQEQNFLLRKKIGTVSDQQSKVRQDFAKTRFGRYLKP